jgi:uncharacterized repeat protein (TIGR01451 family)
LTRPLAALTLAQILNLVFSGGSVLRNGIRPFVPLFFALVSAIIGAAPASAEIMYGLTTNNRLVRFDSATPAFFASYAIQGLSGGEMMVDIDVRPADGRMYGVTSANRLYQIDTVTGAATAVGLPGAFVLSGTEFGIDFNPTVDRLRVVSNSRQNLRINPTNATLSGIDTNLQFAVGDPNVAATPNVSLNAYSNSFFGSTTTTLYDIDTTLNVLTTQNPPNAGTLNTVGSLGVDPGDIAGFDIDPANNAFAILEVGANNTGLYSVNLTTGAATLIGLIGGGPTGPFTGLAIATPGQFIFSSSQYTGSEASGFVTVTVKRVGGGEGLAAVDVSAASGTATAGADFGAASPQTLVFFDGEYVKTFNVPITNDAIAEDVETFIVSLSNPAYGATIAAPSTATVSIADNEVPAANAVAVQLGNLITFNTANPGTILSTVPISGISDVIVGIDFRPATGQLFALGSSSKLYTINMATGLATQVGASGAFTLSGGAFGFDFNPTVDRIRVISDSGQNMRLNPNDGSLTFIDNSLAFAAGDPNAAATPALSAASYTNSFSGATTTTLFAIDSTINALTIINPPNNGTVNTVGPLGFDVDPNNGFDQRAGSPIAFLLSGSATATGPELNTVDLTTGAASLIGRVGTSTGGSSQITAFALVPTGSIALSAPNYNVSESGGVATITVNRIGGSDGTVSATLTTSNGTATAPADYTATNVVVSFAPGVTTQQVNVPIIDDPQTEGDETFTVTLSNPTNTVVGVPASATVTILANDPPADVSITKVVATPGPYFGDTDLTYTLTVMNSGPFGATNVQVTDPLVGTTFVSATPSQGTCNFTTTVTCNLGAIAAAGSATVSLTVHIPALGGPVSNTATVTASEDDPVVANNSSTANITSSASTAIPALNPWMLALLASILAATALTAFRRS